MTITNFLNKIKSEKYVQKITDAIHDAIEQTYEDATKEGNANMEVSAARGTHSTLKGRLDKTDDDVKETTRQLAQTNNFVNELSKGTKGGFATLSDLESAFPEGTEGLYVLESDGYWYYWNGDEWAQGTLFQALEINDFLTEEGQEWVVEE